MQAILRPQTPAAERALRVDLAAMYRIFDFLRWAELIYNHIKVRVPGTDRQFLINPFGLRYREVTAPLPQAFALLRTLQRACEIQLAANSLGRGAIPVSDKVAQKCTRDSLQFNAPRGAGRDVFDALRRLIDTRDISYQS